MENSQTLSDLLSIKSAAKFFGVTPMTISNWRKKRGLPFLILPGHKGERAAVRFVKSDLEKWAQNLKVHKK